MAYTYKKHSGSHYQHCQSWPFIYAVALIGGLTLFSSCSSDDNPAANPDVTPIAWSDGVLPGSFSVNANGQQVQFAQ